MKIVLQRINGCPLWPGKLVWCTEMDVPNFWWILHSLTGNFKSTKDKIAGAYTIRDHIQRAIELDPQDATSRNILGQWCLALASMSWVERRAAATLFGTPPTASFDEALEQFLAAENISPGFWKKNTYLIAETYSKLGDKAAAREWLDKAKTIAIETAEDREVAEQITALEQKL